MGAFTVPSRKSTTLIMGSSLLLLLLLVGLVASSALPVRGAQALGGEPAPFHVIISTDCSPYSDWMSEALIYTHWTSGTRGGITRISSCDDPAYEHPKIWHPRMDLQVTPNYQKQVSPDGIEDNYPIYNKPLGIDYWLNDKGSDLHPDTVVVMMDTDQLIGLPLDSAFRDTEGRSVVKHGTPVGQIYQIGAGWFDKHNCIDMMREECGDSCVDTTAEAVNRHYKVGAPYAMTKADWVKLTPLWTKYTLRVRPVSKGWADDMFGYCLAAMHLGLRHATTTALMLSAPAVNATEAWHLIDGMDPTGESRSKAEAPQHYQPEFRRTGFSAPILHYCQTYKLKGEYADRQPNGVVRFSKYQFKKTPLGATDCSPMPQYPYDDTLVMAQQNNVLLTSRERRDAYMLRQVAWRIFQANTHYRLVACRPDGGVLTPLASAASRRSLQQLPQLPQQQQHEKLLIPGVGFSPTADQLASFEQQQSRLRGLLGNGDGGYGDLFHVIISTDCAPYSDWMSEGLIYTHWKTGTKGGITRISSCSDPVYKYPEIWHPRMDLQVTPNYQKQVSPDGIEDNYPIYNKPLGIQHWLDNKGRGLHPDTVVVMMDTDMMLQEPLENAFIDKATGATLVKHGTPAAQVYQIGAGWFDRLNCIDMMRQECGDSCVDTTSRDVQHHYMVGAPYAMTKADWDKLTPLWTKYTLRVRPVSKGWADDMFGYCLAAMHLGLRHKSSTSLMLSDTKTRRGEAWHYIDGMDPTGDSVKSAEKRDYEPMFEVNGETVPILHYCQTYGLEGYDVGIYSTPPGVRFSKYGFSKRPVGLPSCAPDSVGERRFDYNKLSAIQQDTAKPLKDRKAAYMARVVHSGLMEAMENYRERAGCKDLPEMPHSFYLGLVRKPRPSFVGRPGGMIKPRRRHRTGGR